MRIRNQTAALETAPLQLRLAARELRRGAVVACPTEAVWGFSCDPLNQRAVTSLLELKERPADKGLILVAANLDQLAYYIEPPSRTALRRARDTWPGPATWVFPASPFTPPWITGAHDTVAVRVTAHPVLAALCLRFGGALVSTSANRSGQPPCRSVNDVRLRFDTHLRVVPGATGGREAPTPIREAATGYLLRR
ncbi:MAG: Sua5/YciO/YrdC/YwlC family protein [Stagnimonas sp.]|nr:Sua5/YciO/YrdC/YwlC family protein [Stagnimonas sp.]